MLHHNLKLLLCKRLLREQKNKLDNEGWGDLQSTYPTKKGKYLEYKNELSKSTLKSNQNKGKRHEQHLTKENVQMANKDTKRCSASLANREIQIKTAARIA